MRGKYKAWNSTYSLPCKGKQKQNKKLGRENTVKLGNKERFDKEQIGIKGPFLVTNLPITT